MNKSILFFFMSITCLSFISCSNDKEIQEKAKLWVTENIFPLLNNPEFAAFNEVAKIKDSNVAMFNSNRPALTEMGEQLLKEAIDRHDNEELRRIVLEKVLDEGSSVAYEKIKTKGYSLNLIVKFKDWKGKMKMLNFDVVFSENLNVLNPKIVSLDHEGDTAKFYKLD